MAKSNKYIRQNIASGDIQIDTFKEKFPWIGGDLQTLRDTFKKENLPIESSVSIKIPTSKFPLSKDKDGFLIGLLDLPPENRPIKGVVLIIHGLGGSSQRQGLRRMAIELQEAGFATFRLNLRGAGHSRNSCGGTYCAECSHDVIPAIKEARKISRSIEKNYPNRTKNKEIPLFGVGISLGGTILLNTCLMNDSKDYLLDGLACTSSPLDLHQCSLFIERKRNYFYQKWLLKRLIKQTVVDPFYQDSKELESIKSKIKLNQITTIRNFDESITAPRWGFTNVEDYYIYASPIYKILEFKKSINPPLFLQALDDPWVPPTTTEKLEFNQRFLDFYKGKIILTNKGGHNGFHSNNGCWGDKIVREWLLNIIK